MRLILYFSLFLNMLYFVLVLIEIAAFFIIILILISNSCLIINSIIIFIYLANFIIYFNKFSIITKTFYDIIAITSNLLFFITHSMTIADNITSINIFIIDIITIFLKIIKIIYIKILLFFSLILILSMCIWVMIIVDDSISIIIGIWLFIICCRCSINGICIIGGWDGWSCIVYILYFL